VVAHKEQGGQCAIEDSPDSDGGKGSSRGNNTGEHNNLRHIMSQHTSVLSSLHDVGLLVGGELTYGCNPLNSHVVTVDLRKAKRAEGWRKSGASGTAGVPRGERDV
jgi:hypothetical protein